MSTYFEPNEAAQKSRACYVVDASGITLGRLASEVAVLLMGKHKPHFTKHVDCGDRVHVINAAKMVMSGDKVNQKMYYKHTGFIGNIKKYAASDLIKKDPAFIIEAAVKGMLPKNVLGRHLAKKLRVHADAGDINAGERAKPYQFKYARAAGQSA